METAIVRAWNQAALNGAAFAGKLKNLSYYQSSKNKLRDGAVLLGALQAMKKKGVKMKIERVQRDSG